MKDWGMAQCCCSVNDMLHGALALALTLSLSLLCLCFMLGVLALKRPTMISLRDGKHVGTDVQVPQPAWPHKYASKETRTGQLFFGTNRLLIRRGGMAANGEAIFQFEDIPK